MHWVTQAVVDSVKETGLISCINIPIGLGAFVVFRIGFFDAVGFILLLEATALMLIGGAVDLVASATGRKIASMVDRRQKNWGRDDHDKSTKKAAVYALAGVFLFVEALLLSLATFR